MIICVHAISSGVKIIWGVFLLPHHLTELTFGKSPTSFDKILPATNLDVSLQKDEDMSSCRSWAGFNEHKERSTVNLSGQRSCDFPTMPHNINKHSYWNLNSARSDSLYCVQMTRLTWHWHWLKCLHYYCISIVNFVPFFKWLFSKLSPKQYRVFIDLSMLNSEMITCSEYSYTCSIFLSQSCTTIALGSFKCNGNHSTLWEKFYCSKIQIMI